MRIGFQRRTLLLLAGLLLSPSVHAARESVVYDLRYYSGSDCDLALGEPDNLLYADSMAYNWQSEVSAWSFETNSVLEDSIPEGEDIVDADYNSIGTDAQATEGADNFDIAYLISHGTFGCPTSGQGRSQYAFPDTDVSPSQCMVEGVDNQFGDLDLNLFYTAACNSAQLCVFTDDGYDQIQAGSFTLYAGFHGINTDGPGIPGHVTDFVANSRTSDAGSNWISEMNHIRLFSNDDDCAVVIVFADTQNEANGFYNDGGLDDWASMDVGSRTNAYWFDVDGCDPNEGPAL